VSRFSTVVTTKEVHAGFSPSAGTTGKDSLLIRALLSVFAEKYFASRRGAVWALCVLHRASAATENTHHRSPPSDQFITPYSNGVDSLQPGVLSARHVDQTRSGLA
jgi:hypothetical protein